MKSREEASIYILKSSIMNAKLRYKCQAIAPISAPRQQSPLSSQLSRPPHSPLLALPPTSWFVSATTAKHVIGRANVQITTSARN